MVAIVPLAVSDFWPAVPDISHIQPLTSDYWHFLERDMTPLINEVGIGKHNLWHHQILHERF